LIGAAIWGFSRQPWGLPFALRQQLPGVRLVLLAFVALGGAILFESGYTWLFEHITGRPMPEQMVVTWLGANTQSLWLMLLGIGLLSPIAEEILFRGLLFGAIGKWVSARWTIVLTAILFSLVHLQPSYFLPLFGVGLVLGWARHKSGGLALPILMHCINNCVALLTTKPGH
jgi:membrane protease YdiL (CAAX protease family)